VHCGSSFYRTPELSHESINSTSRAVFSSSFPPSSCFHAQASTAILSAVAVYRASFSLTQLAPPYFIPPVPFLTGPLPWDPVCLNGKPSGFSLFFELQLCCHFWYKRLLPFLCVVQLTADTLFCLDVFICLSVVPHIFWKCRQFLGAL
jgi:hypothetical protein